ncbi:MAG: ATP-binding cassette domain-containing protein [Clostridiales bacterium]|nr:ATP-binding cassette domain-containing protein [Candidatus Equinaster intestinalis]
MEKFYFYEELKDKLNESPENFIIEEPQFADGVVFDAKTCAAVVREQPVIAARVLRAMQVTDIENLPEHVIASYKYEQDIITKQKYIRPDYYVVYYETSKAAVNLTGEKSAAALIDFAKKNSRGRSFYAVDNGIFMRLPIWSEAVKQAYFDKYGEEITDKLLMLFFKTTGSERFRARYYSLIAELIKDNFIEKIKNEAHSERAKFYGFTSADMRIERQIIPNLNTIGFSSGFDNVFLDCPKEIRKNGFIRRYIKYYLDVSRKRTVAKISYEDFCVLPLAELKLLIDRLLASGVKRFCIESGVQNEVLLKKREILYNYINTLGNALCMGKKITDCLIVFPSSTAMGEYAIDDYTPIENYSSVIDDEIESLNHAHVLYDIVNENQLGVDAKISGALVSAGGNTYTGLVLISGYTVLPKTAGFIMKFAENGGRIYTVGDLPEKIDGFKSKKIGEISELIRPLTRSEFSVLRRSSNPVFADSQIDLYAEMLDNNRMLYLASNINGGKVSFTSFDDILRLDTVLFKENSCTMSNKIGKVMGKQIIELDKNYFGTVIFITGKAKNVENLEDFTENLQVSPYFDLVRTDSNTLVLNKCNVAASYRVMKNTTLFAAVNKLSQKKNVQKAKFVFPFTVGKLTEDMQISLYFKNQEKFAVSVNGTPVVMNHGEPLNISEYITEGENSITLETADFTQNYLKDKNFYSNLLLRGNFSVIARKPIRSEEGTVCTENDFVIEPLPEMISLERVLESGFWFFSGSMELYQKFEYEKQFDMKYMLELKRFYGLDMELYLNGKHLGSMYLPPFSFDITSYLENGENELKIILYANQYNVRALQGETENLIYFESLGAKFLARKNEAALLEASEISKKYGEKTVLDSLEFSIKAGEFVVIYGEENSGKTTLLNILGGMERADIGTLSVNDVKINKLGEAALSSYRRKDVAFIFASDNLIDGYSVSDNIELACESKQQVLDISLALRSVGMGGRQNEKVSSLTEFERKKVAVARSLAKNPQIILCDEPTYNMDSQQAKQILHFLHETSRLTEKTVIVATSNGAICDMADRVIRLKAGKIADEAVNPMPTALERIEL